ncbi:MAG: hypothetical protein ACI4F9_07740 [Lachnospiraceae bacterium]
MLDGRLFWEDIEEVLNQEAKVKFTIRDLEKSDMEMAEKSKEAYQKAKSRGRFRC